MLRKSLLTLVGVCVLMGIAVGAAKMFSKPAPVQTRHKAIPKRRTELRSWDGTLEQTYDATFLRAGVEITLDSVTYSGMNSPLATAVVHLQVVPGQGSMKWLKTSAFRALTTHQVQYKPRMKAVWSGSSKLVSVTFHKLPTAGLASDCGSSTTGCIGLDIYGPDGEFAVQLDAPQAPGGYTLGQTAPAGATTTTTTAALPTVTTSATTTAAPHSTAKRSHKHKK